MAIKKVRTFGKSKLIKPIDPVTPVGVKEDAYRKSLLFNSRKRPMPDTSPETSNPSGQVP